MSEGAGIVQRDEASVVARVNVAPGIQQDLNCLPSTISLKHNFEKLIFPQGWRIKYPYFHLSNLILDVLRDVHYIEVNFHIEHSRYIIGHEIMVTQ